MTITLVADSSVSPREVDALRRAFGQFEGVAHLTPREIVLTIGGGDRNELLIFVGSASEGPMADTREAVIAARGRGVRFDAIVIVGDIDDIEQLELVELEFRELLSSQGFDADELPTLHVADPRDVSIEGLRTLIADARGRHNDLGATNADFDDWWIVEAAAGDERRLRALRVAAARRDLDFEYETGQALTQVLRFWRSTSSIVWLALPNRHLQGAAPIDAIALAGAGPVIEALADEVWGGYV